MSAEHKDAMLAMLNRTSKVVDDEMVTLDGWAADTTSTGRQARCLKRSSRIRQNTRPRLDAVLGAARKTPAAEVLRKPTSIHNAMVGSNERSLTARAGTEVDDLSDPTFSRFLDRAETNAADSVKDAETVLRDCTR